MVDAREKPADTALEDKTVRVDEPPAAVATRGGALGALAGNADAIRLYERRGYQPTWLYLSKLSGRSRSSR